MSKVQVVNELHKPVRRNFKRRRVILKSINDLWQADLVEMGDYAKDNRGYRYLLTVINAFSKFGWTVPLKNKTGSSVTIAMKSILEKTNPPSNLQTDMGKEFYNKEFQKLMKKNGDVVIVRLLFNLFVFLNALLSEINTDQLLNVHTLISSLLGVSSKKATEIKCCIFYCEHFYLYSFFRLNV